MERRDLHRGLVVTTDVVAELPILKEVTGALGSRCAGLFAGVVMHVSRKTTELLQKEIERLETESIRFCSSSCGSSRGWWQASL